MWSIKHSFVLGSSLYVTVSVLLECIKTYPFDTQYVSRDSQPYSQNPCAGCKASMTKAHSSHWEGGKGCRDKVHMSRLVCDSIRIFVSPARKEPLMPCGMHALQ